jgi:molybdenum ABC transporter molybdate-binding protein
MSEKEFTWSDDWALGMRIWLERTGASVMGNGRAELLAAIDRTSSISAAAREIGMSYRHAWVLVQGINEAAGLPLVESAVGGRRGGGARLTTAGKQALKFFRSLQTEAATAAAQALRRALKVSPTEDCIHIVAAVSLQEVVGQLLAEFSLKQPAVQARVVYGASNELADHLLGGMTADLFLSADRRQLDRLKSAGLVESTPQLIAKNGLAAVTVADRPMAVRKPADLLKDDVRCVAMAEPGCPLGHTSRTYLQRLGLYDRLLPRVLYVDNSRAVLAALHAGRADVGLAFSNETVMGERCRTLFQTPARQPCAEYFAAILSGGHHPDAAGRLLEFFRSPMGRGCFRRCGFQVAAAPTDGRRTRPAREPASRRRS